MRSGPGHVLATKLEDVTAGGAWAVPQEAAAGSVAGTAFGHDEFAAHSSAAA